MKMPAVDVCWIAILIHTCIPGKTGGSGRAGCRVRTGSGQDGLGTGWELLEKGHFGSGHHGFGSE
jgi:hypothetical protein